MTHHHEAFEKHDHAGSKPCRVCSGAAPEGADHTAGVCTHCWYKILIVILIIMISISYVAWFGLL